MTRLSTVADRGSTEKVDRRLVDILAVHFDPQEGAPFWIERAASLGFDPRREISSAGDLQRMGTMSPRDLADRPIEDFLPRSLIEDRREMVIGQTGGTLGRPVWTVYLRDEFRAAFVTPFVVAARHLRFPEGENWLFVGPSGPHVIGIAAQQLARELGSLPPFTVDFDSRWAKKLSPNSFAAERYLRHIIDQAMAIVGAQYIGVVFSTPPVLKRLAEAMSVEQRQRIRGVHYGGLALPADDLETLQRELFPDAVHLSGYGNTLFGCALELDTSAGRRVQYFPHGRRLLLGIMRHGEGATLFPDYGAAGERGPLVFSRFDRSCLLINVLERDDVSLIDPPANAPDGFEGLGVEISEPVKNTAVHDRNLIY